MEKKKFYIENEDSSVEKHIIISSVLFIIFACIHIFIGCSVLLIEGDDSMNAYLYGAIAKLICAVWFIFRKNPLCGAVCTGVFFFTRTNIFSGEATALAIIIVLAFTAYFAYTTYISLRDWLERIGYFDLEENKGE